MTLCQAAFQRIALIKANKPARKEKKMTMMNTKKAKNLIIGFFKANSKTMKTKIANKQEPAMNMKIPSVIAPASSVRSHKAEANPYSPMILDNSQ